MAGWHNARNSWSFFLIVWAAIFVSGLVVDGGYRLIFGPTHLDLRWELTQSFGWAAGFSILRRLLVRHAAGSEDEQD